MRYLILSKNLLNKLPPDAFSSLPQLKTIDLSGNNIAQIDPTIFRDGMISLENLILSDNILTEIPYQQVATLKQLRLLDLSHNLIHHIVQPTVIIQLANDNNNNKDNRTMGSSEEQSNSSGDNLRKPTPMTSTTARPPSPTVKPISAKLTLDVLHLEYNRIETLETNSFRYFDIVNSTFLDGNPLQTLHDEAFRPCKIRELYIRFCDLNSVSTLAFEGLGGSLQILDLSGNNISTLPELAFRNFDIFRFVYIQIHYT